MIKSEARKLAKQIRAELNMQLIGQQMADALFQLPQWKNADTVLAFSSLPDEPDMNSILRETLAAGKRLLLPRVQSKSEMDWTEITSLAQLKPGAYGIMEAPHTLPAVSLAACSNLLALIPCLAVDSDGVRLGRGGGYYDRFLQGYRGKRLLLCPSKAVLSKIPCDPWDFAFASDEILTEKGIQP